MIPDYQQFYSDFDPTQVTALLSGNPDDGLNVCSECCDAHANSGEVALVWEGENGCQIGPRAETFDDGIRKTDCRTYCTDDPGWPRVLDCRANMGHIYDLSWSWKLILDFFDAHSQ